MTAPRRRILIVEDSKTVTMVEKMMLANQNYDVDTVGNGVEGLKRIPTFKPDLILLDIVMPEMDGIEMCRRVKADPTTQAIPIIMVTTKGEVDRVEAAFLAGCDDYTTKPIDKVELLSKVAKHLQRR